MTVGNGYGSTNTVIRTWTTISLNVGTDITLTQSATNGDSFTINTDGIYAISYCDAFSNSSVNFGISVNSNQLTTSIPTITAANRIAEARTVGADLSGNCQVTMKFKAGDVIRCHTSGDPNSTNGAHFQTFRIVKVSA
jgi:hypothetical protein